MIINCKGMDKRKIPAAIETVAGSQICSTLEPPLHTGEYYRYCLKLLKKKLAETEMPFNIIFGPLKYNFKNQNPTLKIDIQCEHTLVKDGGRGVGKKYFGKVKTEEGDYYLVRIDKYDYLNQLDLIIDYSFPNLVNIAASGYFAEYAEKTVIVSPLVDELNFDNTDKKDTITLFANNSSDRRVFFINEVRRKKIDFLNIDNCYRSADLIDRYRTTRILVNVHQTDHHHTFEELRILPALSNGVIIISETVPLKEQIPYSRFIVWSKYSDLTDTLLEVQNNYQKYYEKIFGDEDLKMLLQTMAAANERNLDLIKKIAAKKALSATHSFAYRYKAFSQSKIRAFNNLFKKS